MNHLTRDAASIRAAIRSCEALNDELMGASARLKLAMLTARANPDVTPHAGQKAFIRLAAAEQAMQETSNMLARTHDELSSVATQMGPDHPPTFDSPMAGGMEIFENGVAPSVDQQTKAPVLGAISSKN